MMRRKLSLQHVQHVVQVMGLREQAKAKARTKANRRGKTQKAKLNRKRDFAAGAVQSHISARGCACSAALLMKP